MNLFDEKIFELVDKIKVAVQNLSVVSANQTKKELKIVSLEKS